MKGKIVQKSLGFNDIQIKGLKEHIFERKEKFFFIKLGIFNARRLFGFIRITNFII